MSARRCPDCEIDGEPVCWPDLWHSYKHCPACSAPTVREVDREPSDLSDSQVKHLKFDAFLARREQAASPEALERIPTLRAPETPDVPAPFAPGVQTAREALELWRARNAAPRIDSD